MQLVESCWVEINPCNGKAPILIGSIYRHPGANIEEFTKYIDDLIIKLKSRFQLYILGDMNIDFLKYNHHTQCNCTQFVKIDEIESSMETITCGVPQGSTLRPLLFTYY